MNLKIGDRIVYRPTEENGGVLDWDGVTGTIIELCTEDDHERWGRGISIQADEEFFRTRIIPTRIFRSYDQRVSKLEIAW
ncbi:MAG: hypothetical protein GWN31_12010, partial [Candidatus Thorarchaeota archaeon]|nr:hypothetical protein [Candidatus Thorarchaeota archaeon]NIW14625.1 hypothetical protein [Candidatus Thorarchaeota archaeon]NIW52699.1 hypothetical protein [Candidatus Korarchaeota archaeon]